jgi:hypothetical protein
LIGYDSFESERRPLSHELVAVGPFGEVPEDNGAADVEMALDHGNLLTLVCQGEAKMVTQI